MATSLLTLLPHHCRHNELPHSLPPSPNRTSLPFPSRSLPRRTPTRVPRVKASFGGLLGGMFKGTDDGESTRQRFAATVSLVNGMESEVSKLSDEELRDRTRLFQERARGGESLDSLLPEAFAVLREASKRVLGLRPFDVQLIGGMVLHKGEIAEMGTGEGRTLVAVLPAYLNALAGKGVHVVTVNDYLARRDCEWVGQGFPGLKAGLIQQSMSSEQRKESYLCDITYVTNSELRFDYLRDNLATSVDELVLRGFNYCVIDEVDSILVDEARTPLTISGPTRKPSDCYYKAAKIAEAFERDIHYTVDEKQKTALLTEQGYEDAEEILQLKDLYDPCEQWALYLLNAIKAKELFLKDVNYITRAKEVLIVDEFTGRAMQGRRWNDGLHQAIEAKEGLPIQNETVTLASISYQNFFLQFSKLCGMTGTASTKSAELEGIYKLKVTLPTFPVTSQSLDLSRFRTCDTLQETRQLHALSVKTGALRHPRVSSNLVYSYAAGGVGGLDSARSLFDEMSEPNLFCYNVLIKYYVEHQLSNHALMLFHELLGEHVPDGFTFPCVLKGCARLAAVNEGKQIHGFVLKIGYGGDKFVESSLLSMYAKCGCVDLARKVFDRMEERDLVCWNSLLDGYARCGEIEVASQLFDAMPKRDCVSWTVLMDGFSKCGKVEAAREIFNKMPNKTMVTWNAMIDGYMKAGNVLSAERLFDDMEKRDIVTWNSMITGYDLNGRFEEAIRMFITMLGEGCTPNQATLVGALSTTSGLASLCNGKWVHSYIVKSGYDLDGVLGTSLVEMYSKCGSIEGAFDVFRSISRKKLGHWTAIIVGLGMHGMANDALQLFVEMRKAGIMPTTITFIGVLNACNHAGLVDHGRHYFDMMERDYGIKPTIEHYGCYVDILCRAGRLKEAKYVINTMPVKPNQFIWMSLLSGARNKGNLKMGEYAAKHVIETAPETVGCYIVLSNMYAAAGMWNKVAEVREMIRKMGIKKEAGCSSIEHKGLLYKFTVGDKSHPQTDQIFSKLTEMGEKLKSAGHVPDTSQVHLCINSEDEKEAELKNHSERLAIAFGLINVEGGSPIRIIKNLRVCNDCHSATKLLSSIYAREIIVRDNSRFHHFKNGLCSCNDFW